MKEVNYYSFSIFASELIKDTYNDNYQYLTTKLYSKFTHENYKDDAFGQTFFFPKDNDDYSAYQRIPSYSYEFYDFYVDRGAEQVDDFMSNPDINSTFGFVLSPKAKAIFEQFELPNHRFFPLQVVFENKPHDYYFLLLSQENQPINYEASTFVNMWNEDEEVSISNYQDLLEFTPSKNGKEAFYSTAEVEETKIVFDNELDLYSAVTNTNTFFYVSERLKEAIEKGKLSGVLLNKAEEPLFFSTK
jgi:hypothetical protein